MAKAKKAVRVILPPEKRQQLKDAIIKGESWKSINERLGVTYANFDYHRGQLKKQGLLEGKGTKQATAKKGNVEVKKATKTPVQAVQTPDTKKGNTGSFNLIVRGVTVLIEGATSVAVGKDYIKIDY